MLANRTARSARNRTERGKEKKNIQLKPTVKIRFLLRFHLKMVEKHVLVKKKARPKNEVNRLIFSLRT